MYRGVKPQVGGQAPFDVLAQVRKLIPFTHGFRANQHDANGQQITVSFSNTNPVTTTISLGHIPRGFVILGQTGAGSVFATTADQAAWTPNAFVCRANASPFSVNLWVF